MVFLRFVSLPQKLASFTRYGFRQFSTGSNLSVINTAKPLYPNSTLFKDSVQEIPDDVLLSNAKREEFMSYFPSIVKEVQAKASTLNNGKGQRIAKIMEYIMPGNVLYNGVIICETYKTLAPMDKQTPENLKLAYYLGWGFMMLEDSFNMMDDIVDGSKTRRNQPCWHLLENIGMNAINDAMLLEAAALYLIQENFKELDCFTKILSLFNDVSFYAHLGQQDEVNSSKNFDNISVKNLEAIVTNICTNFAVKMPISLGMTLAGYTDLQPLQEAWPIQTDLGLFIIVQNDYLDGFGDPMITGKEGTDIQEGKCRWLAVACMERASKEQKELMKTHYGRNCPESVAIIKQLYLDLKLPEFYDEYTSRLYERIMKNIAKYPHEDLKKVFLKLAESVTYAKSHNKPLYK